MARIRAPMETKKLGPLTVRRLVKPGATRENHGDKAAPQVIVLCHGFGAPGDDLVALADAIDVPPGTVFLFPQALHALQDLLGQALYADARCWWLIDFARLERAMAPNGSAELRDLSAEIPEGLADARAALSEMLDALEKEERPSRLVLGGFSQGAMLSLDLALREPERKLAGLVLLSGTMIAEHEWRPLMAAAGDRRMPVFQSHGDSDPILPFAIAERLRDALTESGLDVTFEPFAGPHTIPPRALQRLSGWLRALP